jgi:Tol biopolymer transport system component
MKNPFYLIFILALGLLSCSVVNADNSSSNNIEEQKDYLVYLIEEHPKRQQLVFYEPLNDIHTPILPDWNIDAFSISINNRLAFSSSQDGSSKIYLLDYPFTEDSPIDITPDASIESTPISWSPDGRYLLFESVQATRKTLFLWDGKNILDIHNYHEKVDEIAWSPNGQLAFTEFYTFVFPYDGDSSEVFLWDGNSTTSLSQNPSGVDRLPAWSKDGKLAFLSERNEEYDIFIWDGISKNKGVPDIDTFINIAPNLTQYYSYPTWTNSGTLAFSASREWDLHVQIYEWDGRNSFNISKNQLSHNGGQTWRSDGYWSFTTFFSESDNLYIRDKTNRTILKTKGQYPPAWSQNGLLMFCVNKSPGWTLSLWNGAKVVNVAHSDFIQAKWQNGADVFCSSG